MKIHFKNTTVSVADPRTVSRIKVATALIGLLGFVAASLTVPGFIVTCAAFFGVATVLRVLYNLIGSCDYIDDPLAAIVAGLIDIPVYVFHFFFRGLYKENKSFNAIIDILKRRSYEARREERSMTFNFGDKKLIYWYGTVLIQTAEGKRLAELQLEAYQSVFFNKIEDKIKKCEAKLRDSNQIERFHQELRKISEPFSLSEWDEVKEREILSKIKEVLASDKASDQFREHFPLLAEKSKKELTSV